MYKNFKDIANFTFLSINNIINSSFGTFILIIFVLSGDLVSASNLGVLAALTILLTKIFSLNLRNIYLVKKNLNGYDISFNLSDDLTNLGENREALLNLNKVF